jgi:hypothetical protein
MSIANGILFTLWLLLQVGTGASVGQLQGADDNLTVSDIPEGSFNSHSWLGSWPSQALERSQCTSPWSCCGSAGECTTHCNDSRVFPHMMMKCDNRGKVMVLNCICATYDEEEDVTEIGSCMYDCRYTLNGVNESQYLVLPPDKMDLEDFMCSNEFNRTGTLCGKCQQDYYPLVHSYSTKCVQCPNGMSNWWKYVLIAFLPLTLFFFAILFLRINITTSHLHGFVFYSQAMTVPLLIRMEFIAMRGNKPIEMVLELVTSFYGIWNLDFFRSLAITEVCLATSTLQTLALEYLLGIYPLLLMVVSYFMIELYDMNFKPIVIIWKPFHKLFGIFRDNWEVRTSLIDAFATFFFLSSIKLMAVSFDLLIPVKVYQINSTGGNDYVFRLYYDASVSYFGPEHLPYAVPAIVALVFFVLIPGLLLIVYPIPQFQKILNLFPVRWYILHTFVDSFQGCYKDGTEPGTRDCRWPFSFSHAYFC